MNATSQMPEHILVDNVEKKLLTIPISFDPVLQDAIEDVLKEYDFSTGCVRKYVGNWQIENNKLYLINLVDEEGEVIQLPDAFQSYKEGERYIASWFTGELRVGEGEMVYRSIQNLGFSYYFSKETFYEVRKGVISEERQYENRFIPGAISLDKQLKEIVSQFDFEKFPELRKPFKMYLKFQFVPTPEGKIDHFSNLELVIPEEEGSKVITDTENPYLKEIISLFYKVPQWEVLYLYGEIQPSPVYTIPFINK